MISRKRVVVAMSGGVDSSIVAYLLVKKNYEVIGVNLKLLRTEESASYTQRGEDARNICQKLGIPFYIINCREKFQKQVIDYFYKEYKKGRTPNPCIVCNKKIKFEILLQKTQDWDMEYLATGHYARVEYNKMDERYLLKKGKDRKKDQSYFLFSLSQEQLRKSLFPLGYYTKNETRRLAKKLGFDPPHKPDSQEICFVPDSDYRKFLSRLIGDNRLKPGPIVNNKGEILGEHSGVLFYTIGQRKGLGPHGKPMYVTKIDIKNNTVVIGEEKELYGDILIAKNVNWICPVRGLLSNGAGSGNSKEPLKVKARIRYKHKEAEAVVSPLKKDSVKVKFNKPQRAITPGQAVVFYDEDKVVGGGWIV